MRAFIDFTQPILRTIIYFTITKSKIQIHGPQKLNNSKTEQRLSIYIYLQTINPENNFLMYLFSNK